MLTVLSRVEILFHPFPPSFGMAVHMNWLSICICAAESGFAGKQTLSTADFTIEHRFDYRICLVSLFDIHILLLSGSFVAFMLNQSPLLFFFFFWGGYLDLCFNWICCLCMTTLTRTVWFFWQELDDPADYIWLHLIIFQIIRSVHLYDRAFLSWSGTQIVWPAC